MQAGVKAGSVLTTTGNGLQWIQLNEEEPTRNPVLTEQINDMNKARQPTGGIWMDDENRFWIATK